MRSHYWSAFLLSCELCILGGTRGEITDNLDLSNLNSYAADGGGGDRRSQQQQQQPPPPRDLDCFHCSTVNESDSYCYNGTGFAAGPGGPNSSFADDVMPPTQRCTDEAPFCQVRNAMRKKPILVVKFGLFWLKCWKIKGTMANLTSKLPLVQIKKQRPRFIGPFFELRQ